MAHATIKLMHRNPKKHVVRFDFYGEDVEREDREEQITSNIYISKRLAKKLLKTNDLAKEKGVEVTIRLVK